MIYILEGIHGGGKTTYAKSLGLPIKSCYLRDFELIDQELKDKNDIVYDRLFSLAYMDRSTQPEIIFLNNYFKSLGNVKCLMFICDREIGWQRYCDKHVENPITREEYDKVYDWVQILIRDMDVFEVIDTTNDLS